MLMLTQVAVAVQGHLSQCWLGRCRGGSARCLSCRCRVRRGVFGASRGFQGCGGPQGPRFLRKVTATHKRHSADSRETGALQSNSLRPALPAPAGGSTLSPRSCVRRV